MTSTATEPGPVTKLLEQEVLNEVRRQGIVIWLDKDNAYTGFVDGLASRHAQGEFPFPVAGFRGSFLELLFQLEPYGNGLDKQPLLVHMPGFNEETIRKTPILELYAPGVRYRKAVDTLIREAATARVAPADVEAFLTSQPTLAQADSWLSSAVSQGAVGLAGILADFGPRLIVEALGQSNSSLAARVKTVEDAKVLRGYLHNLTGMDDAWVDSFGRDERPDQFERVRAALSAWLLCVEYVHDLKRPPTAERLKPLRTLSGAVVKASVDIVSQVRLNHPGAYERLADEVEASLADEMEGMKPEDLGRIDTFREEENRVLAGAVAALGDRQWAQAKEWCEARQGEKSFWLQRDQTRRWAWSLVAEAAEFGDILGLHPAG
jgi:hypothetical protein